MTKKKVSVLTDQDRKTMFLNRTIGSYTGRGAGTTGYKFGLELELEGRNVGLDGIATKHWRRTEDGSLRGEAIEYVSSGPQDLATVNDALDLLFRKFRENKTSITNSYRTSTHVHLNFADKTVKQVINFFSLYTMLEGLFDLYAGEHRSGNVFCLSSRLSSGIIDVLNENIQRQTLEGFTGDKYKYAACNLCTLFKYGTVEIRVMRGAASAEQIKDWVSLLNDVYVYACEKIISPVDICEGLSHKGFDAFLSEVFITEGNKEKLLRSLPADLDVNLSLLEGCRLCQTIGYEHDESFRAEVPSKEELGLTNPLPPGLVLRCNDVILYTSTGGTWHFMGGGAMTNGRRCEDNPDYVYHADVGRVYDEARGCYLYFRRHPIFGDEGAAAVANNFRVI